MHADVMDQLNRWFLDEFRKDFRAKYGDDAAIAVVILRQGVVHDWSAPMKTMQFILNTEDSDRIHGEEGYVQNVLHKLAFVLRTGLNSGEARHRPDLLEDGDFPYEGAGTYRGYTGGASGLKEESDWWVFCRVVDKLIELKSAAAQEAIQASKDRVPGRKYLNG